MDYSMEPNCLLGVLLVLIAREASRAAARDFFQGASTFKVIFSHHTFGWKALRPAH